MDAVTLGIWLVALVLGFVAYFRGGRLHIQGLKVTWGYAVDVFPQITMAFLIAGFFSVIVPADLVAAWLGKESGIKGILVASLVGGFIPGGPIISFPIVVVLFKAGAEIPALIAFLTAWSLFAFHRVLGYEIPLVGFRFASVRLLSSLLLPPLAGILAGVLEAYL